MRLHCAQHLQLRGCKSGGTGALGERGAERREDEPAEIKRLLILTVPRRAKEVVAGADLE